MVPPFKSNTPISATYVTDPRRHDEWVDSSDKELLWKSLVAEIDEIKTEGLNDRAMKGEELLRDGGISAHTERRNAQTLQLDPIPLMLSEGEFSQISEGIVQRANLLNHILRDCYEEQNLLQSGLLPPALLYGNPRFNRALKQSELSAKNYLNFYAADIARTEDGKWTVVKDYTQIPEGLGMALENRMVTANLFSDLSKKHHLIRLVHFFQDFRKSIYNEAPSGVDDPLVVLHSSRQADSLYFEDVFLSQYLGITLVDGGELTVREDKVFLKTVSGLIRVHVIIRRIEGSEVDPLEAPVKSYNGVPGLFHVIRAGNVKVINPPGSGVLEVAELYPSLPDLCKRVMGEELLMSSRYVSDPDISTAPGWVNGKLQAVPIQIRVFGFYDGTQYRIMQGGLAHYTQQNSPERGYKDVWVISSREKESTRHFSLLAESKKIKREAGLLSSRAADNLFWLGRYAERSEFATRILLETVYSITEEEKNIDRDTINTLLKTLQLNNFITKQKLSTFLDETLTRNDILTSLSAIFHNGVLNDATDSIPLALSSLSRLTSLSRARLSNEMSRIVRELETLSRIPVTPDFVGFRRQLQQAIMYYSAFNGTCASNITRSRGWHFINIGKRIESMRWLLALLDQVLEYYPDLPPSVLDALLSINDTTITYRFRYQSNPHIATVLDLIIYDPSNPRSLYTLLNDIEDSLMVLLKNVESYNLPIVVSVRRAKLFLETDFITTDTEEHCDASIKVARAFIKEFKTSLPSMSEKLGWKFFTHVEFRSL